MEKPGKLILTMQSPVSGITAANNAPQDFKQSMLRREHTHPYILHSSSM